MANKAGRKPRAQTPHVDRYANVPRTSDAFSGKPLAPPIPKAVVPSHDNWFVGRPIANTTELAKLTRTMRPGIFRIFEYEGSLILPLMPRNIMTGMSYERAEGILAKVQEAAAATAFNSVTVQTGAVYVAHREDGSPEKIVSLSLQRPTSEALGQIAGELATVRSIVDPDGRGYNDTHSIRIAGVDGDDMAAKVASITRNYGLEEGRLTLEPPEVCRGPMRIYDPAL